MKLFEIFWYGIVLFSLISFTYLSAKVLYKGLPELKTMLRILRNEQK